MEKDLLTKYYTEQKPEKRLEILDAMISQGIDAENNEARRKIFDIRYPKKKKQYADQFMAFWLTLKMYSVNGIKEREYVRVCEKIKEEIAKLSNAPQEILLEEWKHLISLYADVCKTDRNYGSIIFGLVKLEDNVIENKIQKDISRIGIAFPEEIGLKNELAIITEATKSVYEDLYE